MSLPSQTGRSGGFRTARFTAPRRRKSSVGPRVIGAVVVLGAVGLAWWWWPSGNDGSPTLTVADAGSDTGALGERRSGVTPPSEDGRFRPFDAPLPRTSRTTGESDGDRPRESFNGTNEREPGTRDAPADTPTLDMGGDAGRNGPSASGRTAEPTTPRETDEPSRADPNDRPATDGANGRGPEPDPPAITRRDSAVSSMLAEAEGALTDGRPVIAREVLNRALHHGDTTDAERRHIRDRLSAIAAAITFSDRVAPGDSMVRQYTVRSGDFLSTIARREGTLTDWRFLQRVNGMANPNRLRVGQRLKLVQGPFHAVVHKSEYRLDLYADERDSAGNRVYLTSFDVGVGEYGSTPAGSWIVKNRLENPAWVNPRDGRERYDADDPENPIGEHWIGLEGTDELTVHETGIGIHGTIEPETIGQQASMGCVRLLKDDVALLFEVLIPGESEVVIRE